MAEINTVIAEASQDLQTIEDFVNLPADSEVYPRLLPSVNVGTLAGTRQAIFEAGGLPATPFATKALMTASALVDGDYAMVTDGGADNGLYVKTAGAWVKSNYDPVLSAKSYTDKLFSTKLTTTTNLNGLPTGNYYISTSDLNAVYDAGNFTSLGYPSALVKGSGATVTVTRSENNGTFSYQSLELVRLGLRFTRYGAVGGSFDEWNLPKPDATFASLSLSDNLNNIVSHGVYFVDGVTANNASRGVRSYPSGLSIAPAVIVVGKDKDSNVVQSLTQGGMTFTRSFTPVTNVVVNDWISSNSIGVKAFDNVTEGFKTVGIGEKFWVYPTAVNRFTTPALYKKESSTETSILYEAQQSSPLDGLIVTEGQLWSTSQ